MRNRLKGGCGLYAPSPWRWLPARRAALAGEWRVGDLEPACGRNGRPMRISLGENAKMALDTLRENKVRSFLTVLGVVIGITALITVSSILVGFYSDVTAYLEDYCPAVVKVVISVSKRIYDYNRRTLITARYKDKEVSGLDYTGAIIENEEVFNERPYVGRFFTEAEDLHRADVAII